MTQNPHHSLVNEELEKKVVATLLYNDVARKFLIKKLPYQALYYSEPRLILKILHECFRENKPIDAIFFTQVLGSKINPIVISDYFHPRSDNLLTVQGCEWGVDKLKELYYGRVAYTVGDKIRDGALNGMPDRAITLANTLTTFKSKLFTQDKGDVVEETVKAIMSPDEYIQSPYFNMRNLFGGFTKKDVTTIFGKSGHNKTTFVLALASDEIKLGLVNKILYVSIDEAGEKMFRRIIAKDLRIRTSDMRHKRIELDINEVRKAVDTIYKDKLIILDDLFTPEQIATAILDIKPDQVIIDHVQEISYDGGISDAGVTNAASIIKHAGRKVGANIFFLSQVRDKQIDERILDKVPRPHDMLYASHLRVKSRELMGVYWKYKDSQNKEDKHIFEVYLHKSTYSDTGVMMFEYNPEYAEFEPIMEQTRQSLLPQSNQQGSVWD